MSKSRKEKKRNLKGTGRSRLPGSSPVAPGQWRLVPLVPRNVETNSGVAFGAEEKGPGEGGGGKRDETDERMKDSQVV